MCWVLSIFLEWLSRTGNIELNSKEVHIPNSAQKVRDNVTLPTVAQRAWLNPKPSAALSFMSFYIFETILPTDIQEPCQWLCSPGAQLIMIHKSFTLSSEAESSRALTLAPPEARSRASNK